VIISFTIFVVFISFVTHSTLKTALLAQRHSAPLVSFHDPRHARHRLSEKSVIARRVSDEASHFHSDGGLLRFARNDDPHFKWGFHQRPYQGHYCWLA
jgi:hypothetical protein